MDFNLMLHIKCIYFVFCKTFYYHWAFNVARLKKHLSFIRVQSDSCDARRKNFDQHIAYIE